jgi:hypothetical protein
MLGDDAILCLLCLPTAPGIAPKLATPFAEREVFRARLCTSLYRRRSAPAANITAARRK